MDTVLHIGLRRNVHFTIFTAEVRCWASLPSSPGNNWCPTFLIRVLGITANIRHTLNSITLFIHHIHTFCKIDIIAGFWVWWACQRKRYIMTNLLILSQSFDGISWAMGINRRLDVLRLTWHRLGSLCSLHSNARTGSIMMFASLLPMVDTTPTLWTRMTVTWPVETKWETWTRRSCGPQCIRQLHFTLLEL